MQYCNTDSIHDTLTAKYSTKRKNIGRGVWVRRISWLCGYGEPWKISKYRRNWTSKNSSFGGNKVQMSK